MSIYIGSNKISNANILDPEWIKEKEVNFYDYEGTLVASYTKQEALALTELPALPDRTSENLTNEGWNMTIADITERINKGMYYVSVGCTYYTTDGKTHITVEPDEDYPTVYLYITPSIANDTTVNWGDGSSDTISSTSATLLSHTYSSNLFDTEIDLIIESTSGLHIFTTYIGSSSNNNLLNKIKKIYTSSNSRFCGANIFSSCVYLEYVTLHKDIIKDQSPNQFTYWFPYCVSLKHLNVPNIVAGRGIIRDCLQLKRASIPYLQSGYYSFCYCYSLDKCETLYARGTSSTDNFSIGGMYAATCIKYAYIDERIKYTESNSFNGCHSLEEVSLPSTIETFNAAIFSGCYKLKNIYLKATTPPTLSGAFTAPNTIYKFYVPRASCAAYKAASNWSDIADHIYPYDYEDIPDSLYFYMPNGGDITLTKTGSPTEVTLEYSIDCGTTWTTWVENSNVRTLTLNAGQTMFVRNTSETSTRFSLDSTDATNTYRFSFTNTVYAGGPLESLICKNPHNATLTNHAFRTLFFNQTNLVGAPNILSTNIPYRAYMRTFYNTRITSCDLSNITDVGNDGCYEIFRGCSNLNNVRCKFTSIGTGGINNWLYGVATTGDLYCPSSLVLAEGTSGIPSGWTRHNLE